jgi:hypothetical protein
VTALKPILTTAPIYNFGLAPAFGVEKWRRYSRQPWFSWGWCNLEEVVQLVNKHFELNWTKEDLLGRFAISADKGRIQRGRGIGKNFGLFVLYRQGFQGEHLFFSAYREEMLDGEVKHYDCYVPAGWVKQVFWSLQGGRTRTQLLDNVQVSCMEDGTPVCSF